MDPPAGESLASLHTLILERLPVMAGMPWQRQSANIQTTNSNTGPQMSVIRSMRVMGVRFPTSQRLDGSDAMHPDPDYSAAWVMLETEQSGLKGHGLTFTMGRGNEICCAAIAAMRHLVVGLDMAWGTEDMGRF